MTLGHRVGLLRVIFRIVPTPLCPLPDRFLAYIQRFDIVPQVNHEVSGSQTGRSFYPEQTASMYVLKPAIRADGTCKAGVIPLQQVRALANLIPRFGNKADRHLTKMTSIAYSPEVWLNKYFNKEMFYALDRPVSPRDLSHPERR